jgi:hypothetical protein
MSASWKPPNRLPQGMIDELHIESAEEKHFRLRREFLSFLVKDILPYLVVYFIVCTLFISCLVALARHGIGSQEGQEVWPVLTAILAGIGGMFLGKATKSG